MCGAAGGGCAPPRSRYRGGVQSGHFLRRRRRRRRGPGAPWRGACALGGNAALTLRLREAAPRRPGWGRELSPARGRLTSPRGSAFPSEMLRKRACSRVVGTLFTLVSALLLRAVSRPARFSPPARLREPPGAGPSPTPRPAPAPHPLPLVMASWADFSPAAHEPSPENASLTPEPVHRAPQGNSSGILCPHPAPHRPSSGFP